MESVGRGQVAVDRLRAALIEAVQAFLEFRPQEAAASNPTPEALAQRDALRTATAALLLQIGRADLDACAAEQEVVARLIENLLGVTAAEARAIMARAESGECLHTPLQELTDLINRSMSREQKLWLTQSMWDVAFADATILAHEEYLVRKTAELLHLSTADLVETKVRAKERFR